MSGNSGPGYKQHPAHRVETTRPGGRVQVIFNRSVIADTDDAIRLDETGHTPVYYVPREHVKMDRLVRTEHTTHCPFKGDASYFTLADGSRTAENAVWSYEHPYDEVMEIRDRLAFYPDKVDSIERTPPPG